MSCIASGLNSRAGEETRAITPHTSPLTGMGRASSVWSAPSAPARLGSPRGPAHAPRPGLPAKWNGNARIEGPPRPAPRALAQRLDGLEHAPGQDPGGGEGGQDREKHEAPHPRPEETPGRAGISVRGQQPERPVRPATDRAHEVRGPAHLHAPRPRGGPPPGPAAGPPGPPDTTRPAAPAPAEPARRLRDGASAEAGTRTSGAPRSS